MKILEKYFSLWAKVICRKCSYTGYKGRTAVFEMFELNEKVKEMIEKGNSYQEIEREALNNGMKN